MRHLLGGRGLIQYPLSSARQGSWAELIGLLWKELVEPTKIAAKCALRAEGTNGRRIAAQCITHGQSLGYRAPHYEGSHRNENGPFSGIVY